MAKRIAFIRQNRVKGGNPKPGTNLNPPAKRTSHQASISFTDEELSRRARDSKDLRQTQMRR